MVVLWSIPCGNPIFAQAQGEHDGLAQVDPSGPSALFHGFTPRSVRLQVDLSHL